MTSAIEQYAGPYVPDLAKGQFFYNVSAGRSVEVIEVLPESFTYLGHNGNRASVSRQALAHLIATGAWYRLDWHTRSEDGGAPS